MFFSGKDISRKSQISLIRLPSCSSCTDNWFSLFYKIVISTFESSWWLARVLCREKASHTHTERSVFCHSPATSVTVETSHSVTAAPGARHQFSRLFSFQKKSPTPQPSVLRRKASCWCGFYNNEIIKKKKNLSVLAWRLCGGSTFCVRSALMLILLHRRTALTPCLLLSWLRTQSTSTNPFRLVQLLSIVLRDTGRRGAAMSEIEQGVENWLMSI